MQTVFSYWEREEHYGNVDLAIIGSGIVGLSAAVFIKQKYPSKKIVVIEKSNFPYGASTKNAGFACFGSAGEVLDDLTNMTEENVIQLVRMRWEGLQLLKELVGNSNIDFKENGGYEVFKNKDLELEAIIGQLEYLNQIIKSAIGKEHTYGIKQQSIYSGIDKRTVFNQYEGQIHPFKMIKSLVRKAVQLNVHFLWDHEVNYYDEKNKVEIHFKERSVKLESEQLIICTNAFSNTLIPNLDLKPARNQVFITKPIPNLAIRGCYHFEKGYVYFRNVEDRLLIGGARHLDFEKETTTALGVNQEILDYLLRFVNDHLLHDINFEIDHSWSGIIAVGKEKLPICKKVSDKTIVGVRLGGMGVAIGSKLGYELSEIIF